MTIADEGVLYQELFDVIKKYAGMDEAHQMKALSLISENYTPFGNLPMKETRDVVQKIFEDSNYIILYGGRPSLFGIETILIVAEWGGYSEWGRRLLLKIMDSLVRNASTSRGAHRSYIAPDFFQTVADALARLSSTGDSESWEPTSPDSSSPI